MASSEWLREHRELQYLRAAKQECRSGTRAARARRRRYADERWRKVQSVNPRFRSKHRPTGPSLPRRGTNGQALS